jgi:post-segregation antitoxin (ccd killing protein)
MDSPGQYERNRRRHEHAEIERRWLKGSREAIARYNRRVAEHGILADEAGPL